jgi:hypothetical protein
VLPSGSRRNPKEIWAKQQFASHRLATFSWGSFGAGRKLFNI